MRRQRRPPAVAPRWRRMSQRTAWVWWTPASTAAPATSRVCRALQPPGTASESAGLRVRGMPKRKLQRRLGSANRTTALGSWCLRRLPILACYRRSLGPGVDVPRWPAAAWSAACPRGCATRLRSGARGSRSCPGCFASQGAKSQRSYASPFHTPIGLVLRAGTSSPRTGFRTGRASGKGTHARDKRPPSEKNDQADARGDAPAGGRQPNRTASSATHSLVTCSVRVAWAGGSWDRAGCRVDLPRACAAARGQSGTTH